MGDNVPKPVDEERGASVGAQRSAELSELLTTYARQVAAFDELLERLRDIPMGEAPMTLEAERMWPHDD